MLRAGESKEKEHFVICESSFVAVGKRAGDASKKNFREIVREHQRTDNIRGKYSKVKG